ncbi:hypothetical protein D915_005074 [Fasciola hepatica]|uniref:Immunoglobulin V-set domain-containing protein n=1 Tax=Fasciola hepatica TaxID=6192 RepID=A0A4E0RYY3_FASHE|nr:hypothetical protein D915_005074 [Fasciola hepatica]
MDLISFLLTLFSLGVLHCSDVGTETFHVQPGGKQYQVSLQRDGIICKFVYQCQGGTNENWRITFMKIIDDKTYGCYVEREGSGDSYLFFQSFKLQVTPHQELLTGSVWVLLFNS